MAIVVKHGVSAAPVAAAAFGGGQGQARSVAARGAAQAATSLEQQRLAQEAAQKRLEYSTEAEAAAAQATRDAAGEAADQRFYAGKYAERGDAMPLEPGQERSDLELGLTARQRAELNQLAEAEAQVMASPDFTDEEKAEARRAIALRRAGVRPVARPREQTPAEKFKGNTYTDPKTGTVYALEDGVPGRPIHEPPSRQPTFSDRTAAWKTAADIAKAMAGVDAEGIEKKASIEDVQAVFNRIMGQEGPSEGGQTPSSPAPQGSAKPAVDGAALTWQKRLTEITTATPVQGQLEPDKVNDLPTADAQVRATRDRIAEIQKEWSQVTDRQERAALRQERDRYLERAAKLEARQEALRVEKEMTEARIVAWTARQARGAATGPAAAPAAPGQAPAAPQEAGDPFYSGGTAEQALARAQRDNAALEPVTRAEQERKRKLDLAIELDKLGDPRLLNEIMGRRQRGGGGGRIDVSASPEADRRARRRASARKRGDYQSPDYFAER